MSLKWTRELRLRWNLFYLSPLFALPGVVLVGIGQPVLAFGLGVMLGWRALELDNELFNGQSTRLGLACNAVVLSMTWTLLTTFALLLVGWSLFYAVS